ncbi:hypothetical protein MMC26_004239 [Xylographa opegraphella]|nr:hypothetical protein [Xylographa opegraphella]
MPPNDAKVAAKRKAPSFKPPRPAAKSKESAIKATPRRKSAPARPAQSLSSSDEDDELEATRDSSPEATNNTTTLPGVPPTIPPELLTTLLKHHFEDKQIRIRADAKAVIGKYMETFVREAIARAAFERSEATNGQGRGGDFLEYSYDVDDVNDISQHLDDDDDSNNYQGYDGGFHRYNHYDVSEHFYLNNVSQHLYYINNVAQYLYIHHVSQHVHNDDHASNHEAFNSRARSHHHDDQQAHDDDNDDVFYNALHQLHDADQPSALVFTPNSVTAAVGSLVQFQFHPMNHSVVQSTFANPCIPINNIMPSVKGIFSGFQPTTGLTTPMFTILINDTQPIWYYCSQGMHCQNGMVGVINPPMNATVVQFAAIAAKATMNLSPGMTMMNTTMGTNTTLKTNATMTGPVTVQTHSAAGSLLAASRESLFSIFTAGIIVLVGMVAM